MTCREVRQRLSAFADGELSVDRAEAAAAHIKSCVICGHDWAEMRRLHTQLTAVQAPQLSPNFTARVMARLRADTRPAPAKRRLATTFAYALIIAAALAIGFLLEFPLRPPAASPKEFDLVSLWTESRTLNLLSLQDRTLALIPGGDADEE